MKVEPQDLRTTVRPSARWLVVLAFGVVPAVLPILIDQRLWPLWFVYSGIVAALFGVDLVLGPRGRDVWATLELHDAMGVGEEQLAEVSVSARSGRARDAVVRVEHSERLDSDETEVAELGRGEARTTVRLRALRRGPAGLERLWLRFTGPLGLCRRTVNFGLDRTLRVVPSLRVVRTLALRFSSPEETRAGLKVERMVGDGSEFEALREWLPGLDTRTIDWKASARHMRLTCREYRAERNHQIVLAVDSGRLMVEELDGVPRLDHAIHAALVLAYMCLRTGDRVRLYAFDSRPRQLSAARSGVGAFPELLQLSTRIGYTDDETNFTLGLSHLTAKLRRRSMVVVMTDFVDSVTAELMVDNVLRLARRHLVVFVALRDPLLDAIQDERPRSLHDIERAVVADSLALERELVLRRLRRHGVLLVETVPEQMGVELLNRYLEVKRREMI